MIYSSFAYAKINISLDIVSKRPDGYHNLKTVMQTIGLYDEIIVECSRGEGIQIHTNLPYIPDNNNNTTAKAVSAFFKHADITNYNAKLQIIKNIPVSAGLGGGSADAACVLKILNEMFKTGFKRETLEELAGSIGADVPFCIDGGTKLAEGKGEILTDLPKIPESHIVVCKPGFSCSTPELFSRVKCEKLRARPDTEGLIRALAKGDIKSVARRMYNVFEDILQSGKTDIEAIKGTLLDCGALGAIMTGSGSAVFGLFSDIDNAKDAFDELRRNYDECFLTKTVNTAAPVKELEE